MIFDFVSITDGGKNLQLTAAVYWVIMLNVNVYVSRLRL